MPLCLLSPPYRCCFIYSIAMAPLSYLCSTNIPPPQQCNFNHHHISVVCLCSRIYFRYLFMLCLLSGVSLKYSAMTKYSLALQQPQTLLWQLLFWGLPKDCMAIPAWFVCLPVVSVPVCFMLSWFVCDCVCFLYSSCLILCAVLCFLFCLLGLEFVYLVWRIFQVRYAISIVCYLCAVVFSVFVGQCLLFQVPILVWCCFYMSAVLCLACLALPLYFLCCF